jgi:hypothetical protein
MHVNSVVASRRASYLFAATVWDKAAERQARPNWFQFATHRPLRQPQVHYGISLDVAHDSVFST